MRVVLAISLASVLLSACTGNEYEPREPGITFSGETRAGVTYKDGDISPDQDTKITISVGGSI
ncbi:hypothetical protein SAMN05444851_2661 [Aliiroseovarius sediminilitoris]|uniref:Uncharacterized protein n=2 Tax=Aliiroseovarius sediminilitoris TaxID=1173584 RepID=A0A1I0QKW1_9RHOB|nr:hypothetical protein SAMN05444851_2661 [Aliiroseovarius sediminilitoris]